MMEVHMMPSKTISMLFVGITTFAAGAAFAADPAKIDWSKVPSASVMLFYPGQSSYQWLRNDHGGIRAGVPYGGSSHAPGATRATRKPLAKRS
jgi:hypothetical protein